MPSSLSGKVVLVTGAGGSIGSEICRQLPDSQLILFDQSEYGLYRIHQEVGGTPILGSCADELTVRATFERYQPDLVIHAAAYKHVPMLEGENAFVGVRNNILGTLYASRYARRFVLISTDKAVNPSCIMGASKRVCELLAAELGAIVVRFGNVSGSAGSVIPAFLDQIDRGGPVCVTHPLVERYFMSISQAAGLVLKAAIIGHPAMTYMLDMGKPRRILDLAKEMIAASGKDIAIKFVGLRPGEKLTEEIQYAHECKVATSDPAIYALHGDTHPVIGDLSWLERGFSSYEVTRDWLFDFLAERDTHLLDRKVSVMQH